MAHTSYGYLRDEDNDEAEPPWSPVPLKDLADSWDNQLAGLNSLLRQFSVTFGRRVRIDGHTSPYYRIRIAVGSLDENTAFTVTWEWDALYGSGKHTQIWTPFLDDKSNDRDDQTRHGFASELMVGPGPHVYFDVEAPAQAWKACGYGKPGPYGFRTLTASIVKTFTRHDQHRGRVPLREPLSFEVQRSNNAPDTSKTMRSLKIE